MDLNEYANECHKANKQWWLDLTKPCQNCQGHGIISTMEGRSQRICPVCEGKVYPKKIRNKGEQLMLIVSEIAEAMEGNRKNLKDDKLPHRNMEEVEMADALIRIFDYGAGHGLDLEGAYREKMAYNAQRVDHKIENRLKENGKSY